MAPSRPEILSKREITAEGVDWEREGPVRASFGLWAALVCWPLLIVWAGARHWRRWRERKASRENADR